MYNARVGVSRPDFRHSLQVQKRQGFQLPVWKYVCAAKTLQALRRICVLQFVTLRGSSVSIIALLFLVVVLVSAPCVLRLLFDSLHDVKLVEKLRWRVLCVRSTWLSKTHMCKKHVCQGIRSTFPASLGGWFKVNAFANLCRECAPVVLRIW